MAIHGRSIRLEVLQNLSLSTVCIPEAAEHMTKDPSALYMHKLVIGAEKNKVIRPSRVASQFKDLKI